MKSAHLALSLSNRRERSQRLFFIRIPFETLFVVEALYISAYFVSKLSILRMGELILHEPLQVLGRALFELTGEKLYELFHFIVRNPYVSRTIRQVRILLFL